MTVLTRSRRATSIPVTGEEAYKNDQTNDENQAPSSPLPQKKGTKKEGQGTPHTTTGRILRRSARCDDQQHRAVNSTAVLMKDQQRFGDTTTERQDGTNKEVMVDAGAKNVVAFIGPLCSCLTSKKGMTRTMQATAQKKNTKKTVRFGVNMIAEFHKREPATRVAHVSPRQAHMEFFNNNNNNNSSSSLVLLPSFAVVGQSGPPQVDNEHCLSVSVPSFLSCYENSLIPRRRSPRLAAQKKS